MLWPSDVTIRTSAADARSASRSAYSAMDSPAPNRSRPKGNRLAKGIVTNVTAAGGGMDLASLVERTQRNGRGEDTEIEVGELKLSDSYIGRGGYPPERRQLATQTRGRNEREGFERVQRLWSCGTRRRWTVRSGSRIRVSEPIEGEGGATGQGEDAGDTSAPALATSSAR